MEPHNLTDSVTLEWLVHSLSVAAGAVSVWTILDARVRRAEKEAKEEINNLLQRLDGLGDELLQLQKETTREFATKSNIRSIEKRLLSDIQRIIERVDRLTGLASHRSNSKPESS